MTAGGQPAASADDWLAEVARTLRGRDLAELSSTTRDGIEIRPLHTDGPERPAAAAATDSRRSEEGWDIRARLLFGSHAGAGADDPDQLSRRIAEELDGGATSVELGAGERFAADDLDRVLAGADLPKSPVSLVPHANIEAAQAFLVSAVRHGGLLMPGSSLGLDPLGEWARSGQRAETAPAAEWARSRSGSPARGGGITSGLAESIISQAGPDAGGGFVAGGGYEAGPDADDGFGAGPGVRVFTVDAVRYADAGATEAQALGWATATGVVYLRALVEAGCSADEAAGMIGFRLAATADQFVTIAALRAARVMWSRVVTVSGGSEDAARQYQHAVTATHMYSRRDPWVNLLRGATAALAAGVGGADAVTVLPFDCASGLVDADGALGRRLARNTQLLLLEESHLGRAADPAGGSFHVESLTDQLASAGWRVLQDLEASGGIEAAIDEGAIAAAIDESWQSRLEALRTRSEPLTGVSEFPLLDEPAPASPADSDAAGDASGVAASLAVRRLAEPFEDLRDAADRHRMASGDRPAVWVAALGSASDHSARTAWAKNLLAAGGIEPRGGAGVDSPIAAAADFAASGLAAAVITGSDDMYRLRGAATAAALADAGAAFLALVCDPGTLTGQRDTLAAAGICDFWQEGIDIVAALELLHRTLGIACPQDTC